MITGQIDDCGLTYTGATVKDVSEQLDNYITENYGEHTVENLRTNTVYSKCKIISSPGNYLITITKQPNTLIHCTIS